MTKPPRPKKRNEHINRRLCAFRATESDTKNRKSMTDTEREIENLKQQIPQHLETADILCNRIGEIYGYEGELDKALPYFHRAIQLNPFVSSYHYNLGLVLHNKGEIQEAIACYTKSIELEPNILAYNNRASLYINQKKYDEAVADCNAALKCRQSKDAYFRVLVLATRADAYMGKEDYEKALRDLEAGMKLNPDDDIITFYDSAIIKCNIKLGKSCKQIYSTKK